MISTTITVEGSNILINSIPIQEIFEKIYQKGKLDAFENDERVTLIQLSKEIHQKDGRKLSIKTLTNKARAAKVKVFKFDGKRNAVYRRDVKLFLSF